jgi:type I restriction enzyme S subunit
MMSKEKRRVPKLRFPGFTEDWEQCKLSVLATMNARIGWQNLRTSEFLDNGDYLPITGTDFDNGRIKYSTCHYVEKKRFDQDTKIQLSTGSILITKDGTLGKVALVEELPKPATLNAGVFNVRVKDDAFLSYKYLYHYLKAPFSMKYVTANATGGTIKHLNQSILVDFPIPITGKQEQDRIAKLLDSLESIITLHQRKLNNLKLKKKALLQKLFPKNEERYPELRFPGFTDAWEQRKLGSLATVEMNKRIFKEQTTIKGDIPFYKIGTFGSDADSFISRELFKEYKNKYPYPNIGDILISASGSIGRTVVYNGEDAYYQDSNIVWLNHNGKIDNSFLLQFYNQVKWAGLEGSTIKRLYNKNILETNIALPKIEEQRLIGKFFELVDRSITLHQRKLDHLQLQKKALLQQMFV